MKVIAKLSNGFGSGLLVEVSQSELHRISGNGHVNKEFEIGDEIKVADAWGRLVQLQSNRSEFDRAIGLLKGVAGSLEPLGEVVQCAPPKVETQQESGQV